MSRIFHIVAPITVIICLLLLITPLLHVVEAEEEEQLLGIHHGVIIKPVLKMGIIGSGITGASSAHYLRSMLEELYDVRITVWERDTRVGGRLLDHHVGLHHVEGGASILHESNRYMKEFIPLLNLTRQSPPQRIDSTMGVWNGIEFVIRFTGNWWMDTFRVMWKYGFDIMRLEQVTRKTKEKFLSVYSLQDAGLWYDSPRALLEAMGVWSLTQLTWHRWIHTTNEWIHREHYEGDKIFNDLAVAALRVNYGQDLDINALAGNIGLIPLTDSRLWAVAEGNSKVVEGLLKVSDATVKIGHSVTLVERIRNSESGKLGGIKVSGTKRAGGATNSKNGNVNSEAGSVEWSETVDIVIVASALELTPNLIFRIPKLQQGSNNIGTQELLPHPLAAFLDTPRKFQITHATFLSATLLNPKPFGNAAVVAGPLPTSILTTENTTLPFTSITAYADDHSTGRRIYKIFSREEFTLEKINQFFDGVEGGSIHRIAWKAYPKYNPPEKFLNSFQLFNDIWYPPALEPAASCLEVQVIAAKNVALAIAQTWNEKIREGQKQQNKHIHL